VTALAPNTLVTWSQDEHPGPVTYDVEGLRLTLSERQTTDGYVPVHTLARDGKTLLEVTGTERFGNASAQIGVGRIDPGSPEPQVLFTTFTGGAHCCADTKLLEKVGKTWKVVDVALRDGDRLAEFPQDYDNDGRVEILLSDDSFLYAFDSYAGSWAPPAFWQVTSGVLKDVSATPGLKPQYQAYLAKAEPECRRGLNGACAAYAAAAARVGHIDEAWPVMLASYQRDSDWVYPTACLSDDSQAACPEPDQVRFETYPESLRWFLGERGYLPAFYIPRPDATQPSFDCSRATGQVLPLICATPELAKADREAAWLYQRQLALGEDPAAVETARRDFLALRDGSPPDVFTLFRVYEARIGALTTSLSAPGR
jgi:hypothetical protein